MISKSFGLLFYLKKPRGYVSGERPIYMCITIDGSAKEVSIQRVCDPRRWDHKTGRTILHKGKEDTNCTNESGPALNAYLDTLQAKVHEARHFLFMSGKPVTAESVTALLQGRQNSQERPRMLLEIFQHHNDQVKALLGVEYSTGTMTKFVTVLNHTRAFLIWKFKEADIDIRKLDYEFVSELEFWHKSVKKCDHNTTMKYIACVKKMAIRALRNGWLQKDPFIGFNMALREVEREALTEEELQKMSTKNFPSPGYPFPSTDNGILPE